MTEQRAFRYARERITLARRDIVKMIETGIEENVPPPIGQGGPTWESMHAHFRAILSLVPANARLEALEEAGNALTALAADLTKALENHIKQSVMGAKVPISTTYRIQTQNPQLILNLAFKKAWGRGKSPHGKSQSRRNEPTHWGWSYRPVPTLSITQRAGFLTGATFSRRRPWSGACSGSVPAPGRRRRVSWGTSRLPLSSHACCREARRLAPPAVISQLTRKAGVGSFHSAPS